MVILMEHMDIVKFNYWAKNHIINENKFDNNGNIIMENDNNYKSTGIIANILEDNWDNYYNKFQSTLDLIRPNANIEVKKVISCANHDLGASIFVCPNDDEVYFCHHTCKGKLCSSCGIKAQKLKTENILEKCLCSKHRHITFTIPNDLNMCFFYDLLSTNIFFVLYVKLYTLLLMAKLIKRKEFMI